MINSTSLTSLSLTDVQLFILQQFQVKTLPVYCPGVHFHYNLWEHSTRALNNYIRGYHADDNYR